MAANSRASESNALLTYDKVAPSLRGTRIDLMCRLSPRFLLANVVDPVLQDDAHTLHLWTTTTDAVLPEVIVLAGMDTAIAIAALDGITMTTVLATDRHLVVPWKTTPHLLPVVAMMTPTDETTLPRRILMLMADRHTTDPLEISLRERLDTHERVVIRETMIVVVHATGKSIPYHRFGRLHGGTILDRRC